MSIITEIGRGLRVSVERMTKHQPAEAACPRQCGGTAAKRSRARARLCACLSILLLAGTAQAVDFLAIEGATGDDDIERIGAAVGWDWGVKWLQTGDWFIGGYWETSFSFWDGEEGRTNTDSLFEFGVAPVFRLQTEQTYLGLSPYAEIGIGAHVMSEDEIQDKDFSILFAFGSHGGVGARFGPKRQFELGYRYQHLSNASIGESNPGINFHIVRFTYHFR